MEPWMVRAALVVALVFVATFALMLLASRSHCECEYCVTSRT